MRHTVFVLLAACGSGSSKPSGTPIPGSKLVIDLPADSTISAGGEITLGPSAPPTDAWLKIDLLNAPFDKTQEDRMAHESMVIGEGGIWDHLPGGVEVFQQRSSSGALVLDAYLDNVDCHAESQAQDMAGLTRCEGLRKP